MSDFSVRKARVEDANAIARVHVETWRATYAGLIPDHYLIGLSIEGQAFQWKKLLKSDPISHVMFVAEVAGKPIGFATGGPSRGKNPPAPAEVYTLYVLGDFQGQGIGRALFQSVLNGLAEKGHDSAYLWVLSENPSRFFYERLGGRAKGQQAERFAGSEVMETAYLFSDMNGGAR